MPGPAPSTRKTASVFGMLGIFTPVLLVRVSAAMAIRFRATFIFCISSVSSPASTTWEACDSLCSGRSRS